jgi:hypothetical protein
MEYAVGTAAATAVGLFATVIVFDKERSFHPAVIANPGVPVWWPGWCLAYDVVAAAYLAVLIFVRRTSPAAERGH